MTAGTKALSSLAGTEQVVVDNGGAVIVTATTQQIADLASGLGTTAITSTSASALAVGAHGATNPVLQIDDSTASVATGVKVKGAAAAAGAAVSTISSGTDENLTIDAKGSGTLTLNGTATGNVVAGRRLTGLDVVMSGAVDARSATATPAAASAVAAFLMGTANVGIYWGTGSPNTAVTAAKGSLYICTDGSSSSTRLYVNTDGATAWTNVTTAA